MVHGFASWSLGALLLGIPVLAQQGAVPPSPPALREPQADARAEYDALVKDFGTAERAYIDGLRKAAAEARARGESFSVSFQALAREWAPKFRAGAQKHAGTDGAVPFLLWLLGNDDQDVVGTIDTLLGKHLGAPEMDTAVMIIGHMGESLGAARVRAILTRVIAECPRKDVQAQALLARANLVLQSEEEQAAEARDAALADLRQGVQLAEDGKLRGKIAGARNEQEHLQVGMVAPDIVGEDLDGVAFKLSDYRGKVILLDFWGYW